VNGPITNEAHSSGQRAPRPTTRAFPRVVDDRFVAAMVVTHNRRDLLRWTLGGIYHQTRVPDDVVVVDNCSSDGTEAMIRAEFPSVRYFRIDDDNGFGAGLARGMASYDRDFDFVWLLEDDSRPHRNALERCLTIADRIPQLGVIGLGGGKLRRGVPVHGAGLAFDQTEIGAKLYQSDFLLLDPALVSRDAIEAVGFPRSDFFISMEDVEYTNRIGSAGLLVLHLDEALVERNQVGSTSESGMAPPARGYYQSRNHLILALEHRSPAEVMGWMVRQMKFCIAALFRRDRVFERIRLRLLGGWHAVRGVRGKTI
jgi:rhamnopyranosyl-N-acetylglucosaminyl-diphospho-decaprenol beta-1,3/1,4-galactofuranosyltransferase